MVEMLSLISNFRVVVRYKFLIIVIFVIIIILMLQNFCYQQAASGLIGRKNYE